MLFEDVCFDAQQAVEKALKALIILRDVQVPRTHAISELITMLAELGFDIPEAVQEAAALTDYAVAARYPGPYEPVLLEDYEQDRESLRGLGHQHRHAVLRPLSANREGPLPLRARVGPLEAAPSP